jgi:hypothetical protein
MESHVIEQRIHAITEQTSDEVWEQGLQWYDTAHRYCQALAKRYHTPVDSVVGIVAALSPQTRWSINKEAAKTLLAYGNTPGYTGYSTNVRKAERILAGEAPGVVLGGYKVRAFYSNILSPGDSEDVTVDRHIVRIVFDVKTLTRKQLDWAMHRDCRGNTIIQNAYRNASKTYNIRPCELQAVTWLQQTALSRRERQAQS